MPARLRVCAHPRRNHYVEQRLEGAARLVSSCLRSRVTLLARVEEQPNWQSTINSAERLPRVSCAFRNYAAWGNKDEECAALLPALPAEAVRQRVLRANIWLKHRVHIQ